MEDKFYKWGLILLFGFGIILRLVLFLQNSSLWGDEVALALNVCNKSYRDLFGGLDMLQASPVGFTIIVKFLLNCINPQSDYLRDLTLRILPFISGILIFPLFHYLLNLIFKNNKKAILISLFFLIMNPCAITYTVQFKQYSTELLCSILILICFYKLLILNKYKWSYTSILAIVPWFSYSSFIMLAAGFICLLIKNWRLCLKIGIVVCVSCVIYYFTSLKYVFTVNFLGMRIFWENAFGFMDLCHPIRFLFRFGELFALGKLFSGLTGFVFFAIYIRYCFYLDKPIRKFLLLLPLVLTIIASLAHKYAIQGRLILFLLPTFAIIVALMNDRISNYLKFLMASFMIVSIFNYIPSCIPYSYSRQIVDHLKDNIKDTDIILLEHGIGNNEYDIYLDKLISAPKVYIDVKICDKTEKDRCKDEIRKLPKGNYYFLSLSYFVKEITENYETRELEMPFHPQKTKAIYFIKES